MLHIIKCGVFLSVFIFQSINETNLKKKEIFLCKKLIGKIKSMPSISMRTILKNLQRKQVTLSVSLLKRIEKHINLYSIDEIIALYKECLELDFRCYTSEKDGFTRDFRLREGFFDCSEDEFSPFISQDSECDEILEKYEEHFYKELLEEYNQDNTDNEFDEDDFSYFVREEYEKYCDNTDIKEILRTINAEIDYKMCMLGYIKNFYFESEESYL